MRLLVCGGAGFIGSNFVRLRLADNQDEVTVLDKLTYAGNLANLAPVADSDRYTFVQGDICDAAVVSELIKATDDKMAERGFGRVVNIT